MRVETVGNAVLHLGDALTCLRAMPDRSAQCCVTSPPYWGLRDYGVAGQLGLEPTPAQYVAGMVAVFHEAHRVLRDDGTLWLNLGDCYATGAGAVGEAPGGGQQGARWRGDVDRIRDVKRSRALRDGTHAGKHTAMAALGPMTQPNRMPIEGLKPKDLVGIPWRVAFALQADGWHLRQDIIWAKPNPMPESVRDRCTKAHEYLFLLSKSERYHYDADAIAEESVYKAGEGGHQRFGAPGGKAEIEYGQQVSGEIWDSKGTRNKRSVWTVATQPYAEAHFATFPPKLIEPCVLAGCPVGGVVLDPFAGSGTSGEVALLLGRKFVGIELNQTYFDTLLTARIENAQRQSRLFA